MEEGASFLLIGATTTSVATPSESNLREVLFSTFEALGGITHAIVHFDVLSIKTSASAPNLPPLAEIWVRLHKDDVKFVKGALPTFSPPPNSNITGLRLLSESAVPPTDEELGI